MIDQIEILVNASHNGNAIKRFRRTVEVTTKFGGWTEINGKVNKLVNKEFPNKNFSIITCSWHYA